MKFTDDGEFNVKTTVRLLGMTVRLLCDSKVVVDAEAVVVSLWMIKMVS